MDNSSLEDQVWKRLKERIRMDRIRLAFLAIFNVLGFVVLYIYYVLVNGIDYANQNTFQELSVLFAIQGMGLVGYFLYLAFYEIPAEIDKEKDAKLQELAQQKQDSEKNSTRQTKVANQSSSILDKFSFHLDQMVKDEKFSSPAISFLNKVRVAPPFLGIVHAAPVLLPEHEKALTEYFRAVEFVAKNKFVIKGGGRYQCKENETEEEIAKKVYGDEKFAKQIIDANPGGYPFSTGQMINQPRIDVSETLGVSTDEIEILYAISQGKLEATKRALGFLLDNLYLQYDEALKLLKMVYDAAEKALKEKRISIVQGIFCKLDQVLPRKFILRLS